MNKSKQGYLDSIEKETIDNTNFRKVLFTGGFSQLVVMDIKPLEEIGLEKHEGHDQFIRVEKGVATVVLGDETFEVQEGDAFIITSGILHNVTNTSPSDSLKLYTIYSPAEHKDGLVQEEKPLE